MNWISVKDKLPEYGTDVLGYALCTCGLTGESHRLNCSYLEYFIAIYREKDYWSPFIPDYWIPLPNKPDYLLSLTK